MGYDEADDARLLVEAARGDEAAFGVFYRRWLPLVTGYHLRRTRSRELAFDLTAETFAAIVSGLERFDPNVGRRPAGCSRSPSTSCWTARAGRGSRAQLARGWVTSRWCLRIATSSRVEELASLGDDRRLDRLLAQLPAPQRDAVRARVLDERSCAEIAVEMECSEAVVRQRVHRGLDRLRERLKETR